MRKRIMSEAKSLHNKLQRKLEEDLPDVTSRPMFGYLCYSVKGKFFAGFSKKDKDKMIIRLSKGLQEKALQAEDLKTKPFSHGANMGWIELDGSGTINNLEEIFFWIKQGYDYARTL